jgi:hypothetical protein
MLAGLILAGMGALAPLGARVQESEMCWEPDIEYPVPCEDDD